MSFSSPVMTECAASTPVTTERAASEACLQGSGLVITCLSLTVDAWDDSMQAIPPFCSEPALSWSVGADGFDSLKQVGALPGGCGYDPSTKGVGSKATEKHPQLQDSLRIKDVYVAAAQRQTLSRLRTSDTSKQRYQKMIANATCLRMMYIPENMHCRLNMASMYPMRPSGRRGNTCTIYLSTPQGLSSSPVTMTRSVSKRPHHRQLTKGWRDFCVSLGVQVGDTLTFSLGCRANELRVSCRKKSPVCKILNPKV